MDTHTVTLRTGSRPGTHDITAALIEFCSSRADGLVNVFVPHATAALAIIEVGAGSDHDLIETMDRLVPRDERWSHRHGSPGHGADHLLPALLSPSIVLPVIGGRPALGEWQSVVLVDLNVDKPDRQVIFSHLTG